MPARLSLLQWLAQLRFVPPPPCLQIVAVAQLVNKLEDGAVQSFNDADVELFSMFSPYAAVALRIAWLYNKAQVEGKQNYVLLSLAHKLAQKGVFWPDFVSRWMPVSLSVVLALFRCPCLPPQLRVTSLWCGGVTRGGALG